MTSARIHHILLGWVEESLGGKEASRGAGGNLVSKTMLRHLIPDEHFSQMCNFLS